MMIFHCMYQCKMLKFEVCKFYFNLHMLDIASCRVCVSCAKHFIFATLNCKILEATLGMSKTLMA